MDIPLNVEVHCVDGLGGRSTTIILNPVMKELTHLVVAERKAPHTERLVPIELVVKTTPQIILLHCTRQDLSTMDRLIETEYIKADDMLTPDDLPEHALMWPYYVHGTTNTMAVNVERIPPDEIAIRRGAHVKASDGRIGVVEGFLVDSSDGHITHLVLRKGHLWGQHDLTIPVSDIDRIEQKTVHLKLDKATIAKLPAIPIRNRLAE